MAGDTFIFIFPANHEPGDVLQKDQRDCSLTTELDEMCPFLCRFGKKDSVVCDEAYGVTPEMRESANQRGTVSSFKFVKFGTVDQTRNHFTNIVWFTVIGRNNSIQFLWVCLRLDWSADIELH